jgi:putative NIF3 family GTP cyclohydrolase 1 type 2
MKAHQVRDYFVQHATWVDWADSVDAFKCGDPDAEVRRVAVLWMLTVEAIERVSQLGANLVVTHEPTFYTHVDAVSAVGDHPVYARKRELIEQAGLTVLRIHDSWDGWPGIGIGDSLATLLGLGEAVVQRGLHKIYQVPPMRLDDLAAMTGGKIGVNPVLVAGDPNRMVSRIDLAYGALGGLDSMNWVACEGVDAVIAGELSHWKEIRYLLDCGVAVILTDHAASENPGLRNLAEFIHQQFNVPADFVEVGSPFHGVAGV